MGKFGNLWRKFCYNFYDMEILWKRMEIYNMNMWKFVGDNFGIVWNKFYGMEYNL